MDTFPLLSIIIFFPLAGAVLLALAPRKNALFIKASALIITLLEIEERSIKEIAQITGWSGPLVKVRAFRARAELRRVLSRMTKEKYL